MTDAPPPSRSTRLVAGDTASITVVAAAFVVALAASWLSDHYGAPVMLFALLLGMAVMGAFEERHMFAYALRDNDLATLLPKSLMDAQMGGTGYLLDEESAAGGPLLVGDRREAQHPFQGVDRRRRP